MVTLVELIYKLRSPDNKRVLQAEKSCASRLAARRLIEGSPSMPCPHAGSRLAFGRSFQHRFSPGEFRKRRFKHGCLANTKLTRVNSKGQT